MPAYQVQRSQHIDAAPERVFEVVSDFSTWTSWSPWLKIEPTAKVEWDEPSNQVGSLYRWEGELVGAGEIETVHLESPRLVDMQLRFLKPFKSRAGTSFVLEPDGQGTMVTWHMRGSLPWFLFWMMSSLKQFIGLDYQRGLKMLKEHVETGSVSCKLEVGGVQTQPALRMVGLHAECPLDQLTPKMDETFDQVVSKVHEAGLENPGEILTVYHSMNMKLLRVDFTSGLIVGEATAAPTGLQAVDLPAGEYLNIRHIGRYEHLGNAWSGAYQVARYRKIKLAKSAAYEVYRNDPGDTPDSELVTDIYLPVKS